mmetsp:Transcript_31656/g.67206  ORF Transcript_31656/g.67206 Transcript_31656/m.67206 type:complete len:243 (-) Transcript_31656:422-1150(-)
MGPPFDPGRPYTFVVVTRKPLDPAAFPMALALQDGSAALEQLDCAGNCGTWKLVPAAPLPKANLGQVKEVSTGYGDIANARAGRGGTKSLAGTMASPTSDSGDESEQRGGRGSPDSISVQGDCYILVSNDVDRPGYLSFNMRLTQDDVDAERFQVLGYDPPRRNDVPENSLFVQLQSVGTRALLCADENKGEVFLLQEGDAQSKDQNGSYLFNEAWELVPDEDLSDDILSQLTSKLVDPNMR